MMRLYLNWQDTRPVPRYCRLQYKYSKLVDSSGNKECELPTADSCAIMEGEDAEDDIMYFTKRPFFSKIKSYSREVSRVPLHANTPPAECRLTVRRVLTTLCVYRGRQTDSTLSPWSLHRHNAYERRKTLKMNNSRMIRVLFFSTDVTRFWNVVSSVSPSQTETWNRREFVVVITEYKLLWEVDILLWIKFFMSNYLSRFKFRYLLWNAKSPYWGSYSDFHTPKSAKLCFLNILELPFAVLLT